MDPKFIAAEVRRRMEERGFNSKQLSLAAGLNETYIRDLLKGRSSNPRLGHIARVARALGCTVQDLGAPPPERPADPTVLRAARLAAMRMAWWRTAEQAADALGVSPEFLAEQESGRVKLNQAFLLRFLQTTSCPPSWIFDGDYSEIRQEALVRIAVRSPDLVPGLASGFLSEEPEFPTREEASGVIDPD